MSEFLKATYGAPDKPLIVNGVEIPCYVLEDGQRVLVQSGLLKALGMSTGGANKAGSRKIDEFIDNSAIKPFITSELRFRVNHAINFKTPNGANATGYEATILIDICDAVLQCKKEGKILKGQYHIAEQAELLIRSFAKVGIIALIDEATGYQYDREKDELQKILTAYIAPELLPWQKRFPDEFYTEIFRLKGWDYTVNGIKKRPGVIGTWTKKLIYNLLPKGVLEELEKKTPKSDAGNKTKRLHQSLTLDIGEPHLEKQLISVITLMNISEDWKEFLKLFAKKFQKDLIELAQSADVKHRKIDKQISGQQYLFVPNEDETIEINEAIEKLSEFNLKLQTALNYNVKDKE